MSIPVATRKEQLEARLAELHERVSSVEEELSSHEEQDWADRAKETEDDEVREQLGLAAAEEMEKIAAAILRIEKGEYGYCMKCGTQISDERLDVVPYATMCRRCA